MQHAALRQVVVKVAPLGFACGVAAFFLFAECFVPFGLCGSAFQFRPDPRDEHDVLAVGQPFEGFNARRKLADAPRLAASGVQQVELPGVVLGVFLFAFADEGDATRLALARR